ncbi:hypothetical protein C2E23DRAFT_828482 [Lenzites betulinus]|nr:hypothetical protein C2E23DRAFT_828482 [Lenzites betulinus]
MDALREIGPACLACRLPAQTTPPINYSHTDSCRLRGAHGGLRMLIRIANAPGSVPPTGVVSTHDDAAAAEWKTN